MALKLLKSFLAVALLATIAVAVPVAVAPDADASAEAQEWFATVDRINDGDTFEVNWNRGDPQPSGLTNRIRVIGVDTNEVSSNQCFAAAADAFTEARIPSGTVVKLVARDIGSNASNRPLRHVFYGPNFQNNLALELVEAGLGLAASYDDEPDYRGDYYEAAERAYVAKRGMWAAGACGGSPSNWPDLDVHVNWDAAGADNNNENGEYVQIRNNGPGTLNMGGWSFRSSARKSGNTQAIPSGTSVPAGGTLRIRMGSGQNTATNVYLGHTSAWFDNDTDIFYLRDNNLNIRAFQVWPCTVTCGEYGTVAIEAVSFDPPGDENTNPNGEWVRVRNVGDGTVDLTDWKLQDNGFDYHFQNGRKLAEGQTLTVYVGSGTDNGDKVYWGNPKGILANDGDALWIFNGEHVPVDCYGYGSVDCRNEPVRGAIRLTAHYDAKGNDAKFPNREWVALENTSDDTVNISGLRIRVGDHAYRFKSGTRIKAGQRLRLRVGSGRDTAGNKFWGKSAGIMANGGGSVQLRDGNEVLLEHRWRCGDCGPDGPFVIDEVKWNAKGIDSRNPNGEWITIRNAGNVRANLRDYLVTVGKRQYVFVKNKRLNPGQSLRIRVGKGKNTTSNVYWGYGKDILANKGKRVALYSPHREMVDCHGWGKASCPAGEQGVAAGISVAINYDAEGDDNVNLNGEWVDLRNRSSRSISLAGYELYSDGAAYVFDSGDVIPAGARMRIRSGRGSDSGLTRYAHNDLAPLANTSDEVTLRTINGKIAIFKSY